VLNLRRALSTICLTGRTVSKEALSNAPDEDVLDAGLGILKELVLSNASAPLSDRACFEVRRCVCGCGMLNGVLRLITGGGSSSSDSVSSSSHKPGY
jgi:hypothetical protein